MPTNKRKREYAWTEYEKKALEFLEKFVTALGAMRRYSQDSSFVREALKATFEKFMLLVPVSETLTFTELHDHLLVDDIPIPINLQTEPLIGSFVFFLLKNNMQGIRFRGDCSEADMERFLAFMAKKVDQLGSNPNDTLRENKITGVSIISQIKDKTELPSKRVPEPPAFGPVTAKTKVFRQVSAKIQNEEKPEITVKASAQTQTTIEEEDVDDKTRIINRPVRPGATIYGRDVSDATPTPVGTVRVVIMAKLGRMVLDGASVTVNQKPPISRKTVAQQGAIFVLPPGPHKFKVSYDTYQMELDVMLRPEDKDTQVDINLLDAINK